MLSIPQETPAGFNLADLPAPFYTSDSLRSLTLRSDFIDPVGPDFWPLIPSTLRELALVGNEIAEPGALEGLVSFLSRSNNLITFTIYKAFLQNLAIAGPIGLPALRELTIADARSSHCLRLIRALDCPGAIRRLTLDMWSFKVLQLEGVLQCVYPSSTQTQVAAEGFVSLGVGYTATGQMCVAAGRASDPPNAIQRLFEDARWILDSEVFLDVSLCVAVEDEEKEKELYGHLSRVLHCLDLTCVRNLQFSNFHPTLTCVLHLSAAARSVQYLRLTNFPSPYVLTALGLRLTSEQEASDGLLLEQVENATDIFLGSRICTPRRSTLVSAWWTRSILRHLQGKPSAGLLRLALDSDAPYRVWF